MFTLQLKRCFREQILFLFLKIMFFFFSEGRSQITFRVDKKVHNRSAIRIKNNARKKVGAAEWNSAPIFRADVFPCSVSDGDSPGENSARAAADQQRGNTVGQICRREGQGPCI